MTKRIYNANIVSQRLKELRKEKILTQKELAEMTFFSISTIKQYEAGNRIPDKINLDRLSKFYGVQPEYILGETDFKTKFAEMHHGYFNNFSEQELEASKIEMEYYYIFCKYHGIDTSKYPDEWLSVFFDDVHKYINQQLKKLNRKVGD